MLVKYSISCFLIIGFTSLLAQSYPPPKPLTDEEQIRSILHKIEQGIKQQNILKITDGIARVYQHGDSTSTRFLLMRRLTAIFNQAQNRWDDSLFQVVTPPGADLTSTWDFEMEIDTIRVLNDQIAQAKTWIYFSASEPDSTTDWQFGKKHRENIIFRKINGEWRVKKVDKLLKILRRFGNL